MALYNGQTGTISRVLQAASADPPRNAEPSYSGLGILDTIGTVTQWVFDAIRAGPDVTAKAIDYDIQVPSAMDCYADIVGYSEENVAGVLVEYFHTFEIVVALQRFTGDVGIVGPVQIETIDQIVEVNRLSTWRTRVRFVGMPTIG